MHPSDPFGTAGVGCEVHTYAASELNKGDGGPTCLTRPVWRG